MDSILIVGNFNKNSNVRILKEMIEKYRFSFSIYISGANLKSIKDDSEISGAANIVDIKSPACLYQKYTAHTVIFIGPDNRFHNTKFNQRSILFVDSYELSDVTNIDAFSKKYSILTGGYEIIAYGAVDDFDNSLPEAICDHLYVYKEDLDDIDIEAVLDRLDIRPGADSLDTDIVVLADDIKSVMESDNNFKHILDLVTSHESYNLILISPLSRNGESDGFRELGVFTSILDIYSHQNECEKLFEVFDGAVFYTSQILISYIEAMIKNARELTESNTSDIAYPELKLFKSIYTYDARHVFTKDDLLKMLDVGESSEKIEELSHSVDVYRDRLDALYGEGQRSTKISVVMCSYNTKPELLTRAIASALDSTHRNLEVVMVDDGSKEKPDKLLAETFADDFNKRLFYYYKENEGQGLARNYGIERATGEYLFFLDSDDVVHSEGLARMLTHAQFFGIDAVIGNRRSADSELRPIHPPFAPYHGGVYKCYYKNARHIAYRDQMPNNKLILKKAFVEHDLWFNSGNFEDLFFTGKLYSRIPEYHYINVECHYWILYGKGTTMSSRPDYKNCFARLRACTQRWETLPESVRSQSLQITFTNGIWQFYESFSSYPDDIKVEVFNKIRDYLLSRQEYYLPFLYYGYVKVITKFLMDNDYSSFAKVCDDIGKLADVEVTSHDDYFVHTHYQLLIALVHAINSGRASRLIIDKSYERFDAEFVTRLDKKGVFIEIITIRTKAMAEKLFRELEVSPNDVEHLIPANLFAPLDHRMKKFSAEDKVFIFSTYMPYWYYIKRKFTDITMFANADGQGTDEYRIFCMNDEWKAIETNIPEYYPSPDPESGALNIVLSNEDTLASGAGDENIRDIVKEVYGRETAISKDSVVILTEPLSQTGLCTRKEHKALYKRVARRYNDRNVFIKPHPVDNARYDDFGYTVLNRDCPTEAWNFLDVKADTVIAVNSYALHTADFATHVVRLSDGEDIDTLLLDFGRGKSKSSPTLFAKRVYRKLRRMIKGKPHV